MAGRLDLRIDASHGAVGTDSISTSTLSIAPGSLVAIVGPSGAGKTTLLRAVAGLVASATRRGSASDRRCGATPKPTVNLPTRKRSIGFVFQDYALFPNMTVRGNVDYAIGSTRATDEVDELLRLVALDGLRTSIPTACPAGRSSGWR